MDGFYNNIGNQWDIFLTISFYLVDFEVHTVHGGVASSSAYHSFISEVSCDYHVKGKVGYVCSALFQQVPEAQMYMPLDKW